MRQLLLLLFVSVHALDNQAMHVATHAHEHRPLTPPITSQKVASLEAQARYWKMFFEKAETPYQKYKASKKSPADTATAKMHIMSICKKLLLKHFPKESRLKNETLLTHSAEYEYRTYMETRLFLEKNGITPEKPPSIQQKVLAGLKEAQGCLTQ